MAVSGAMYPLIAHAMIWSHRQEIPICTTHLRLVMGRSKMNLSHCNTEREIVRQRGKAKQREKAKEREKQRGKEEELEAEDKTG